MRCVRHSLPAPTEQGRCHTGSTSNVQSSRVSRERKKGRGGENEKAVAFLETSLCLFRGPRLQADAASFFFPNHNQSHQPPSWRRSSVMRGLGTGPASHRNRKEEGKKRPPRNSQVHKEDGQHPAVTHTPAAFTALEVGVFRAFGVVFPFVTSTKN
jgi:hypothetical protein